MGKWNELPRGMDVDDLRKTLEDSETYFEAAETLRESREDVKKWAGWFGLSDLINKKPLDVAAENGLFQSQAAQDTAKDTLQSWERD